MLGRPKIVLASGSPRRLSLLNQAGIEPDALRPADVDETPKRGELPRACANRLARAKADAALKSVQLDDELRGSFILAADTVVAVGRRILPKANLVDEAAQCLRLLSGRNHRVYTAICLVTPKEAFRQRLIETRVRFKRLSEDDIQAYIGSGEWRGKAGGYAVQGIAGSFVVKMVGSYTNVVGLPLYEIGHAAGRRGFSDPVRLAQCQLSRPRMPAPAAPRPPSKPCPECGKPASPATAPFCSPRCRDVDLNRWLSGKYVIPGQRDRPRRRRIGVISPIIWRMAHRKRAGRARRSRRRSRVDTALRPLYKPPARLGLWAVRVCPGSSVGRACD